MNLKIASLNVRGIGNNTERREVFNWLRSKNFSICMLQEAHCTENTRDIWTSEWGYKTLFSCCSSNKAGVGILFKNNFNLKILKAFVDPNVWPTSAGTDDPSLSFWSLGITRIGKHKPER